MRIDRKKSLWTIVLLTPVAVLLVLLLASPRARASLRWTAGFRPLPSDGRIFYERGAEAFARQLEEALPQSLARVEECQTRPVRPGFRVYVCASHESFTRHMGYPPNSPVRGAALLRDVWISPKAFDFHGRDTHRESLTHEFSHLHLGQHLGWWRRTKNLPSWFSEALADRAADTGREIVSREEAREALLAGRRFVPDGAGRLPWPRGPRDYGVPPPMLHAQARLFVEFLLARDSTAFTALVQAVVEGRPFEVAFERAFGDDLDGIWRDFLSSLASGSPSAGAARVTGPGPARTSGSGRSRRVAA